MSLNGMTYQRARPHPASMLNLRAELVNTARASMSFGMLDMISPGLEEQFFLLEVQLNVVAMKVGGRKYEHVESL